MQAIIKYKATDGQEFNDEKSCLEYEALILNTEAIMSQLPKLPSGVDFSNGNGYIQHNEEIFKKVRLELLKLIQTKIKHQWVQQSINDTTVHPSWVGRLLNESNLLPLEFAWNRIYCIDPLFREWGQPYYVANPDKATQKQLNPTI